MRPRATLPSNSAATLAALADEVVIGKVAKPITVSAFAAPQIAYLGQLQPADDITIPEAKDGGIKKQGVKLLLPDGIKFAAKPTVKVP